MTVDSVATSTAGVARQDDDEVIETLGLADLADTGDGGGSDCEHESSRYFVSERDAEEIFEPAEEILDDDDIDDDYNLPQLYPGVPPGWQKPGPPPGWVPSPPKQGSGCPDWEDVDNPGDWSEYSYQARHNRSNQYKGHFSPTGATVVPEVDGSRAHNGWDVTYDGSWETSADTPHRHGAKAGNMIPEERVGQLDGEYLKKMGLTKDRMEEGDALFFYQLLYPLQNPARSHHGSSRRRVLRPPALRCYSSKELEKTISTPTLATCRLCTKYYELDVCKYFIKIVSSTSALQSCSALGGSRYTYMYVRVQAEKAGPKIRW